MTLHEIAPFIVFAFVTSITPGPNNTMVLASGVNFGFRATIPHLLGIDLGFALMMTGVGAGLGGLFTAFPILHTVLKYVGGAYLLYLAWRIANSGSPNAQNGSKAPMTFLQAALFQWLNPKGWMAAIGAVAAYTPADGFFISLLILTVVFALIMGPCITLWAAAGAPLRDFLSNPLHLRIFNIAMAALLVASLYPIFAGRTG
jgi:threonine/homoserine/homoserine lactone efflux protein